MIASASAAGDLSAARFRPADPAAARVARTTRRVTFSEAYLQNILDQEIGVHALASVWADYSDAEHDRVILEVSGASDAYLHHLASTYDPSAIAVYAGSDARPVTP